MGAWSRIRRRERATALLAAMLLLAPAQWARAQADPTIVKATFLYRFASFVQWPASVAPDAPVTLCLLQGGLFLSDLQRLVSAAPAGGRAFLIRVVDSRRAEAQCNVLYLNSDEDSVRQALRETDGAPVLTVTDANLTPQVRGIVHFVVLESRVRFHIDDAQAAQNHLSIDPRLLTLAVSVRRRTA